MKGGLSMMWPIFKCENCNLHFGVPDDCDDQVSVCPSCKSQSVEVVCKEDVVDQKFFDKLMLLYFENK